MGGPDAERPDEPQDQAGIRDEDKALAVRLSTSTAPAHNADLLQLAAIYAALPDERRQRWFERLGACGVSAALRDQIAERARRMIRFPDWRSGERLRVAHERKQLRRSVFARDRRRWSDV